MVPLLKFFFTVSYVALAAFVGAFADAIPKGRVMFITNTIKVVGCVMMFLHRLRRVRRHSRICAGARRLRGSGVRRGRLLPAKYGILTELLPRRSSSPPTAGSKG